MIAKREEFRVCLLGATFATHNMGVSALAMGSIRCILHRFPHASIFLLDYGKNSTVYRVKVDGRKLSIPLVNMRFSKRFYLPNNIALLLLISLALKCIPFRRLRQKLMAKNFCLRHIREASIAASIAGGDSFSETYGLRRLLYVSLPQFLVLFCGKRLVLLPQTLGPFRGKFAKAIARYILTRAELVYSRDYAGIEDTRALLGPKSKSDKLRFCYDVGFVVDPVAPAPLDLVGLAPQRNENSSLIGLNISGLLYMGGYTRNNMFGLKTEYRELIYSLLDFLIRRKKAVVLLISHVFGGHGESDSLVCQQTYEALKTKYGGNLALAGGRYNHNEIKYIIGLCDFFVGSRMHACIAALSQNVPAVAIAYSDKFVGVMETIGVESLVVDARKTSKEEIFNIINEAYDRRVYVRQQLENRIPQVRETVLNLFNDVEDFTQSVDS